MTKREDFTREAATVALEASDDTLARQAAALAYRRELSRKRTLATQAAKRRQWKATVRRAGYAALVGGLFGALASCAYFMNWSHGYL